jgi:hypothetical protein
MIYTLLLIVIPLLVGSAVSAQDARGLERGLESIAAGNIRSDLYFFADRAMRGRSTPSKTQRVAARFLSSRLMRLGWQPAGDLDSATGQRSWFQEFEVYLRALDLRGSYLRLQAGDKLRRLRLGKDYFVSHADQVRNFELEGAVVFCGLGREEDLHGLQLQGAWALCVDAGAAGAEAKRRLQEMGALGVLFIDNPAQQGDRIGRQAPRNHRKRAAARLVSSKAALLGGAFPEAFLKRSAAASLLSMGGHSDAGLPEVGQALNLSLKEKRQGSGARTVANVCALWPGSDPKLKHELILISAHYDHLTPIGARVFQGADDNGSGSMGLLALAEALQLYGAPKRSVMLLWLTAEEHGLRGSQAFVNQPTLDEDQRAICNINIDMIGRNGADSLFMTPSPQHASFSGLAALAHALAPLEGFANLGSADDYWQRSDHFNFSTTMGLPVVFLFAGVHGDYHMPTDTPDKVNYDKVRRATRLVLRLVDGLQADLLKL